MHRSLSFLALSALSVLTPALSAEPVHGWIETERQGANLRFTAFAQADANVQIRYELTVRKDGRSGRASSQQAGQLRLAANAPRRLSQSIVNIADGDDYCVRLAIYRGNTLVANQIITPPDEPNPESCSS